MTVKYDISIELSKDENNEHLRDKWFILKDGKTIGLLQGTTWTNESFNIYINQRYIATIYKASKEAVQDCVHSYLVTEMREADHMKTQIDSLKHDWFHCKHSVSQNAIDKEVKVIAENYNTVSTFLTGLFTTLKIGVFND